MFVHLPPENILEFPAKTISGQRWYKTPTGNLYPSITTILSDKEKPELEAWKLALGPKAPIETKRAADRGTSMHEMTEKYLHNDPDYAKGQQHEHVKLFNKVKHYCNRINNIRMQENALFSDILKVAGRVDCIAEYEGVLSVVDFKTSTRSKPEKYVYDYFLQETFYALGYYEMYGEFVEQIVTIIAVENNGLAMIWKRPVKEFIVPLQTRINQFYEKIAS